jgi:hypothetical protein
MIDNTKEQLPKNKLSRKVLIHNQNLDQIHEEEKDLSLNMSLQQKRSDSEVQTQHKGSLNSFSSYEVMQRGTLENLNAKSVERKTSADLIAKVHKSDNSTIAEWKLKLNGEVNSKSKSFWEEFSEEPISYRKYEDLYTSEEKKLLAKVLNLIWPNHMNKIRASILKKGNQLNDMYSAIERMAFERDPERQIRVTHLDYNSLEPYEGPIMFSDGMRFI